MFEEALGLVLDLEGDAALHGVQAVEGDDSGVVDALGGAPGDPVLRDDLGEFGDELLVGAGQGELPGEGGVVDGLDVLDVAEEGGPALDLGPEPPADRHRSLDVDGFEQ